MYVMLIRIRLGLEFFVGSFRWTIILGQCHNLESIKGIERDTNILLCIANTSSLTERRRKQKFNRNTMITRNEKGRFQKCNKNWE